MRNVSHKSRKENQNTHFRFNNFFSSKILSFMRYVDKYGRAGQAADGETAISKAKHTHAEYVIFVAIPLQQRLRERASVSACLLSTAILQTL